jgi:hypothetical protein
MKAPAFGLSTMPVPAQPSPVAQAIEAAMLQLEYRRPK